MIRADALTHLQNQFSALATATGQATTDTANGYGPALDQALRQLGYTSDQLADADTTDAQTPDYLALAEYYALVRFWRALVTNVDVAADAPSMRKSFSQIVKHVKELVDAAKADLTERGYLDGSWTMGVINLDLYEPSEV